MKINRKITTIVAVLILAFSFAHLTQNSFAYWGSTMESSEITADAVFSIGTWSENPYETWAPNITYYKNDIIYYDGNYYRARRTTTNLAPNSVWYSFFFWTQVTV
jgi:hypothetical protein